MTSAAIPLSPSGPLGRQWFAVARSEDLHDGPAGVRLLGSDLVLWRSPSGAVVAAPDRCTHSRRALSKGTVKGGLLACPKHGWTFGDQGHCVLKPSGLPINEKAHLGTHPCAERYGLIWVCLRDPATEITDLGWDTDGRHHVVRRQVSLWQSSAMRTVEAFLAKSGSTPIDVPVEAPFTVHGTSRSERGTEQRHLITCAPADGRTALVSVVSWTTGGAVDDDRAMTGPIQAYLDEVKSAAEAAEAQGGPSLVVDIPPDEQPGPTADWKRRLLAVVAQQVA